MRVGFVLRSAEIKPLFFDLFSYQIIMKDYEMCVYSTHVLYLFGIEHLRRAIVSCSTSPPQIQPTNRFVSQKHAPRVSAPFCGVRRLVERVLSPLDRLTVGEKDAAANAHGLHDRRTTRFWVRAHTAPHKSYPGLLLGFDSRLVDEFGHTR